MGKKVGALYKGHDKTEFCIWAPFAESLEVIIKDQNEPVALSKDDRVTGVELLIILNPERAINSGSIRRMNFPILPHFLRQKGYIPGPML